MIKALLVVIIIFTVVNIYKRYNKLNSKFKLAGLLFLILLSLGLGYYYTKSVNRIFSNPTDFDFLCFYMNGNVAVRGLNFYHPQNYAKVYEQIKIPFTPSASFVPEIINVGFLYFPPTMLLFLPLGLFNFSTSQILWNLLLLLFFIIDFIVLWKYLLKDKSLIGFLLVFVLFLLIHGTVTTFSFDHYTFIFLFPVLLYWKDKDSPIAGLWITLSIFLKPIFLILILFPILRKKWKTVGITLISALSICLITIGVFGSKIFFSYFKADGIKNLPVWSYTESTNQSLLSTILRITKYDISIYNPLHNPLFIILGLIILLSTFLIIYKLNEDNEEWALALFLTFMLFIYPGNQVMYSVILLPAIILLINKFDIIQNRIIVLSALIAIIYGVMFIIPFFSYLLLWVILIAICLYKTNYFPKNILRLINFQSIKFFI